MDDDSLKHYNVCIFKKTFLSFNDFLSLFWQFFYFILH